MDVEIPRERATLLTGRRPATNFANLILGHLHPTVKFAIGAMTTPKTVK